MENSSNPTLPKIKERFLKEKSNSDDSKLKF